MRLMPAVARFLALPFCTSHVMAASQVVLLKGDGKDQILTVTADGGSAETSITFICEPPKRQYGVVVQAPRLSGGALQLKADAVSVPAPSPLTAKGSTTLLLEGAAGQRLITRLTGARIVEAETEGGPVRFALSDGPAEVARFRRNCGL